MTIYENYSLLGLNTFQINVLSTYFTSFTTIIELQKILTDPKYADKEKIILGGGSNILFIRNFDGLILKNNIKGIEKLKEDSKYIFIRSGAGEVWQDFVLFCINNNYGGVENLSLIPGTVGASPIQNIGAYGVEIKDVLESVEFYNSKNHKSITLHRDECKFGYRDSIFKRDLKGSFIITSVIFKLTKNPVVNISYGAIKDTLTAKNILEPSIKDVSEAVSEIRRSKLPDPAITGNAGSFFKNPEIPEINYKDLKENFPDIPCYPTTPGFVKIPAGWLIEQCGWKGKSIGRAGVHRNQALVLINLGGATGNEIKELSETIKNSVKNKFRVELETEVNII